MCARRLGLVGVFVLSTMVGLAVPAHAQQEEVWDSEMKAGLAAMGSARLEDARRRFERAVRLAEGLIDKERAATSLVNLADVYRIQGEYTEAEALTRRAIGLIEQLPGIVDAEIATALNNLAALLDLQGRYPEAMALYLRALQIRERTGGGGRDLAVLLNNLGAVHDSHGDADGAERYYRRAIDLGRAGAQQSADVAVMTLNNAGVLFDRLGRIDEAEAAFREALERAGALEEARPEVATTLHNLGVLELRQPASRDEAERLLRRSLELRAGALPDTHPDIAMTSYALAEIELRKGRIPLALDIARGAARVLRARLARKQDTSRQAALNEQRAWRSAFLGHLGILREAIAADPARTEEYVAEAFDIAQLAKASDTSNAVASMAARFAVGSDDLARVVRARQDLLTQHRFADSEIIRFAGMPSAGRDAGKERQMRRELDRINAELERLDRDISSKFPSYRTLTGFDPVDAREVRSVLAEDEALATYLFGDSSSYLFVITRAGMRLFALDIGRKELERAVRNLRRHLDPERATATALPAFPVEDPVMLYDRLLRPAEALLAGRAHLIVVADSALESLPFSVLLTEKPAANAVQGREYARYPWLIGKHALSYVPSVSSLHALRQSYRKGDGKLTLAAFADPILRGSTGEQPGRPVKSVLSGKIADVEKVRQLDPLPETAEEVLAIAKSLDADSGHIYLRAEATEARVKSMDLSLFQTVIFATHGLMAGEFASISEPALVLTPPEQGSELDDGLLTVSEIAKLRLNADWVILSACNTAAADGTPGAEGLSGFAKAFFYAGSRALLVSHWAIASHATVELTTTMFRARAGAPAIGKAEALRRAALHMILAAPDRNHAHPMFWAALVVVGEGGAR